MDPEQKLQETRQFWNQAAATFDNEPDHGLQDPLVRAAWTNLLKPWLPSPPASILDIGCGTGSLSVLLTDLTYTVTGIDLSPAMIARAEAKAKAAGYSIPFRVMDASDPQFPLHQFDAIVCRHLLWTLPELAAALQHWSDLLAPGGRLLLIEGTWHTGAGLSPPQVVAALPSTMTVVTVENLSSHTALWGTEVTDQRYMVIVDQSGN